MREIKFRAWWDEAEIMLDVAIFNIIDEEVYYLDEETNSFDEVPFDDVVIEQYTGFKDINGKEIYEGDILHEDLSGDSWLLEVYRDRNTKLLMRHEDIQLYENIEQLEVVGNVHENPELLELIE